MNEYFCFVRSMASPLYFREIDFFALLLSSESCSYRFGFYYQKLMIALENVLIDNKITQNYKVANIGRLDINTWFWWLYL